MAETLVYTPESAQANNILPWMLASQNNNGGLFGNGNGWAGAGLGFIFGLLFGNGAFGNGLFGNGGNGAGTGFISNQLSNDSGRELLMNAILSQGEASRAAIQNLSTVTGQDFNLLNSQISTIQGGLSALTAQTGMSALQIINAIQSGNASLASQLCQCCCEQRQLTVEQGYQNQIRTIEQTNTLGSAIASASQRNTDSIADLKSSMISEFCAARERDMQEKIDGLLAANSTLRSQIDNANQTAAITGYVNSVVAPLQKEVTEIASKMPNTVPVQWPALTAVNTTPYVNGGYYPGGFGGFGYGSSINF